MSPTPLIELRGVTYAYPNQAAHALVAVDLAVDSGEFILLAGHSGSGKSTLLRALNGLVPHFTGGTISGTVQVAATSVLTAGPRALSRTVGFVSQNPENQSLLEVVEEEIAFPLEQAAIPSPEMRVRVATVLELLELTPLRSRALATLSGGERQRVAIATALALQPQVLLLDEPTSQLDPESAAEVLDALARLNDHLGLTILIAEHRLERIIGYVDRTILLEDGRIVRDGPTRELAPDLPYRPPLIEIGHALDWQPLPLTIEAARIFAAECAEIAVPAPAPAPRTSSAPVLELRELTFAYSGKTALSRVNLELHQGELLVVLGRNGSGKSTLLKCIMALLTPQEGEIFLHGFSTLGRTTSSLAAEIAMLPQNPDDLLFAESVAEELQITLRNHGLFDSPASDDLLARLGLSTVAGAYPRDLSAGQRQRVALGAVAVTMPRIMLLDEPTRGLDGGFKQQMLHLWRDWLSTGVSLLVVTHDVELAAQIADRVVILAQGQVAAVGAPHHLLGASSPFASEIARLFPAYDWLTAAEARRGLAHHSDLHKI